MSGFVIAIRDTSSRYQDTLEQIEDKCTKLESFIGRLELFPEPPGVSSEPAAVHPDGDGAHSTEVFIVHGHDVEAKEAVARFISKLGLNPIILHEKPNEGRTIIEKLEAHSHVGFAVVLLTPDDEGRIKGATTYQDRARQNVILELGYFVGKLGRNKVCALHRGSLELPSDVLGVIYVPYDLPGAWRLQLAKELKAAKFAVNADALL